MIRKATAELVGTVMLLAVIVGSGIMGERLAMGNDALALLCNAIATGAGLIVLIQIFGPVCGAHFNPAVTLAFTMRGEFDRRLLAPYIAAQIFGAIAGVWIAHAMFAEPILQFSAKLRDGPSQGLSEIVATFGLIGTIFGVQRSRPDFTPVAVGLYIVAAYWFTASTSFANPAVTIARSLSDSFAGIALPSVPMFIFGQIVGTVCAVGFFAWLFREDCTR